jgi:hypothetical protein
MTDDLMCACVCLSCRQLEDNSELKDLAVPVSDSMTVSNVKVTVSWSVLPSR